jgi:DnaJ-class molecular chaperone
MDADEREAWEELEAYLRDDAPPPGDGSRGDRGWERGTKAETEAREAARQHLRTDYANLEVEFAAAFADVRKSYRKLLVKYHPDRNALDPEKFRIATEITKKINASFQRIREFEGQKGTS